MIDVRTVLFAVAVAALVAVACSLLPALRTRRGIWRFAKAAGGGTAGRMQHRVRSGLVAAQIALALVVLAARVCWCGRSAACTPFTPASTRNRSRPSGFPCPAPGTRRYRGRRVLLAADRARRRHAGRRDRGSDLTRATRIPRRGSATLSIPKTIRRTQTKLPPLEIFTAINGDYFRAMGIPILAGRTFDRIEAQREGDAIVSRRTAELFWKDATGVAALGKRFRPLPTGRWYT